MRDIEMILNLARSMDASDIHISYDIPITFRVDGQLLNSGIEFDNKAKEKLIMQLLNDEQIKSLKNGIDIDTVYIDSEQLRYRINVYKEKGQYCAAIRIISPNVKSLEELDLPEILKSIASKKNGLVIVTGPTGSGKSTTLAAMIKYINENKNCHIITIEDPIEYVYKSNKAMIHQREIGDDVVDFKMALKSAMREDPDVILVGEMRDLETIQAVLTLAETGHLVFSTLHTMGATKTIDRIIDVFPANKQDQIRTQLAGVLNAVISQQLVPNIESGRSAAFEIMVVTNAIRNMIREKKNHMIYSNIQMGNNIGMQTMYNSLRGLLNKNKISIETFNEFNMEENTL